jgi:hypothetical protein
MSKFLSPRGLWRPPPACQPALRARATGRLMRPTARAAPPAPRFSPAASCRPPDARRRPGPAPSPPPSAPAPAPLRAPPALATLAAAAAGRPPPARARPSFPRPPLSLALATFGTLLLALLAVAPSADARPSALWDRSSSLHAPAAPRRAARPLRPARRGVGPSSGRPRTHRRVQGRPGARRCFLAGAAACPPRPMPPPPEAPTQAPRPLRCQAAPHTSPTAALPAAGRAQRPVAPGRGRSSPPPAAAPAPTPLRLSAPLAGRRAPPAQRRRRVPVASAGPRGVSSPLRTERARRGFGARCVGPFASPSPPRPPSLRAVPWPGRHFACTAHKERRRPARRGGGPCPLAARPRPSAHPPLQAGGGRLGGRAAALLRFPELPLFAGPRSQAPTPSDLVRPVAPLSGERRHRINARAPPPREGEAPPLPSAALE